MKNLFDLSGKRALVTGGGRGLGRALALGLAQAGVDVVIASRNLSNCQAVAAEIRALGPKGHALSVDMSRWEQVEALAQQAFDLLGGMDILVNNAGQTSSIVPAAQVSAAYFSEVFAINVGGPYAASRAAIEVVSQVTAVEWVGMGVRVNAIAPGALQTDMLTDVETMAPGTLAAVTQQIPMKRVGAPDEIVGALLYLASDASSYATGTVLSVNGGW